MTISTDQKIESKFEVLQTITNDVTTHNFNEYENFIENIVLVGRDNVIDCKTLTTYLIFNILIVLIVYNQLESKFPFAM